MKTLHVSTWFERDRAYIALLDEDDRVIVEFWDEGVDQAIEDGFIDMRNLKKSLIEYAIYFDLLKEEDAQ